MVNVSVETPTRCQFCGFLRIFDENSSSEFISFQLHNIRRENILLCNHVQLSRKMEEILIND